MASPDYSLAALLFESKVGLFYGTVDRSSFAPGHGI
jgi:hypothetical protein